VKNGINNGWILSCCLLIAAFYIDTILKLEAYQELR